MAYQQNESKISNTTESQNKLKQHMQLFTNITKQYLNIYTQKGVLFPPTFRCPLSLLLQAIAKLHDGHLPLLRQVLDDHLAHGGFAAQPGGAVERQPGRRGSFNRDPY